MFGFVLVNVNIILGIFHLILRIFSFESDNMVKFVTNPHAPKLNDTEYGGIPRTELHVSMIIFLVKKKTVTKSCQTLA